MAYALATLILSLSFMTQALAADRVPDGVVAAIKNKVRAYRNPSKVAKKTSDYPQVKFIDAYYDNYPLTKQSPLYRGDIVVTLQDSHVKFIMNGGDVIVLGPESQFEIQGTKSGPGPEDGGNSLDIRLWYGRVRSVIKKQTGEKQVRINSPNAVVGVRGTDFYTEYDVLEKKTKVAPLHGTVEVTNSKSEKVVVEEGKQSEVATNKDQTAAKPTEPKVIEEKTISSAVFITTFKHEPAKDESKEEKVLIDKLKVSDEDFKKLEAVADVTVKENTDHLNLSGNEDPLSASIKKYEKVLDKIYKSDGPLNERIFKWMSNF